MARKLLIGAALIIGALWLNNNSLLSKPPAGTEPKLIAHRGLAQTYHREGLTNETCTAERIDPPTHPYLENTIASMQAAFEAGAVVVEIDIHPTPDGHWAVFHDWTLDCRTDGAGVTRQTPMSVLKMLDIGYGYTADGGATYPFRGQFIGAMPTLADVIDAFPEGRFLINFKGGEAEEGRLLARSIAQNPAWADRVWGYYGGADPTTVAAAATGLPGGTKPVMKECLLRYIATGWSGHTPEACRDTILFIPQNYTPLMWGWPHTFTARMDKAGAAVVLIGAHEKGDPGTTGIDTAEQLNKVPERFSGYVWTDRIEVIGPMAAGD